MRRINLALIPAILLIPAKRSPNHGPPFASCLAYVMPPPLDGRHSVPCIVRSWKR